VSLPQGLDPALIPQEIINNILQQVQNSVPQLVMDQVREQSPPGRIDGGMSGYWKDITASGV
jgi:hypothetical protein